MRRLTSAALLVTVAACHHRRAGAVSTDGIVSITGTSFEQQIILQRKNGPLRLIPGSAADSAALTRLGGVEISVRGDIGDKQIRVESFTAVRVGDQPVLDGILRLDGTTLRLQTSNGSVTFGNPPAALREMVGARVWIMGPPSTGPISYGVITRRQ